MSDPVRRSAASALTLIDGKGLFADEAIARSAGGAAPLGGRDRALLFELVYGTLRWRGRIDYFLGALAHRSFRTNPPEIRNLLRIGAYQILFLDRVPPWAAVDTATELAKEFGNPGQVRFVNGVLRNLVRRKEKIPLPGPGDTIPHLAVKHSCPEWLVRRWVSRFGKERAERLLAACNKPPATTLRINSLKPDPGEYLERLAGAVEKLIPHQLCPEGVVVEFSGPVEKLPGFREGRFYVQDGGAILISRMVGARAGNRILDACAAPGGKASHLAELMADEGEIIALEVDPLRLGRIEENMERLGITIVRPLLGDGRSIRFGEPFDHVLIDAPCSGLGTIRRHPEAKWRKKEEDLARHRERQLGLLRNLSRFVRAGGSLVYSTCSTEPEENGEVIGTFLREEGGFTVAPVPADFPAAARSMIDDKGFFHAWPDEHDTDGFFAVRLVRQKDRLA
ncbi:MAG: 16S rRNA (cytosine(967)-C(5))-methyltransferase RsmB [Deltaproteobacteria bacterium]|nr:16S rRNA (cytosine(967)-C(5))-methyltransferase RsmB [Deltaproteobacteria bacterium]